MALDYVGSYNASHGDDLLHFGVKGMRWGVRNSQSSSVGKNHLIKATTKTHGSLKKGDVVDHPDSTTGKIKITSVDNKRGDQKTATGNDTQSREQLREFGNATFGKAQREGSVKLTRTEVDMLHQDGIEHQKKFKTPHSITAESYAEHERVYKAATKGKTAVLDKMGVLLVGAHGEFSEAKKQGKLKIEGPKPKSRLFKLGKFAFDEAFMSDDIKPNDYIGAVIKNDDILHYGVKGMRWGIRNDKPGSALATHRAAVDKKHLARGKALPTKGARIRKGLTTDFTLSPYRSAGRLRRGKLSPLKKISFNDLTGKQQSKILKSLARDRSKLMEKKLPKNQRGKKDYLSEMRKNPKLRDSQIKYHAGLLKFGKRNKADGESRKKYTFTQTNWPRLLPLNAWGAKTGLAANTLGISALATRAISRHSDDISAQDYLGVDPETGIEHFGVKGMKWGVRNNRRITASRSTSAVPTRARKKEEKDIKGSKEVDRLIGLRERVKEGKATVSLNGKKLSSDQAVKAINKDIEKNVKGNKVVEKRLESGTKMAVAQKIKPPDDLTSESSVDKYSRLKLQAKTKGAKSLDNEDLQFLNARTAAISQANKAFASPDSWLVKNIKSSIDAASGKLLKDVVQAAVTKHAATKLHLKLNLPSPVKATPPVPIT